MKYYLILILLVLAFSCRNTNETYDEKVYLDQYGFGEYVFLIDGKLHTNKKGKDDDYFRTFPADDSIFAPQETKKYYKQKLSSYNLKYDTIEMASYIPVARSIIGFLFNLRVVDAKWEADIYYSYLSLRITDSLFNSIRGTYSFNITESEDRLFKKIVNSLQESAKQKYYPTQDTIIDHNSVLVPAIYIKTQSDKEQSEYFGALDPTIYDSTMLFDMLAQITCIILGNHILPENKISDTITLLDVRKQFDSYVGKDCCTGFYIDVYDNMVREMYGNVP